MEVVIVRVHVPTTLSSCGLSVVDVAGCTGKDRRNTDAEPTDAPNCLVLSAVISGHKTQSIVYVMHKLAA